MISPQLHSKQNSGFTLLELTVAMIVGLMIVTISLTLFTQQLSIYKILRTQNFMIHEAPQINSMLNSIVSRANSLTVVDENQITLTYNNPGDNTATTADITFANGDLTYKSSVSEWKISTQIQALAFVVDRGVLRTQITGPNDGEIKYSTTPLR